MEFLYQKLEHYHEKNIYPFHMPGHKRNEKVVDFLPDLTKDITEIEGFDYLHRPTGILRESQMAAARLYGADETYYSVNGSTGALLAAVRACTTHGGTLLMARNCHQSVYHAVCLGQLTSHYLYPETILPYGLNGSVLPDQVEEALASHSETEAVLITSPTYDGVVSPVKEIAKIVHRHGLPLIVDEAHGAHFPFHEYFPVSALEQGADVVVHSLHKTLPALTQTALIHVKGDLADRERIQRYMGMYQTSSPSYLLMGSMDACIQKLQASGLKFFEAYVTRLKRLRKRLSQFQYPKLAEEELLGGGAAWDLDRSKLILDVQGGKISGHLFYEWLLKKWNIQMEMETETYVLGMTSAADTDEGYERLCCAVEDAEKTWQKEGRTPQKNSSVHSFLISGEAVCPIGKAMEQETVYIPFFQSTGYVAGDFLYLYPPGIPLAVPGERITEELIEMVRNARNAGLEVRGLTGISGEDVAVIREELF